MSVAGVIEPTLQAAEIRRSAAPRQGTLPPTIFTCALLGTGAHGIRSASLSRSTCSRHERSSATRTTVPHSPPRRSTTISYTSTTGPITGTKNRLMGLDLARKALRVAPDDPDVLGRAAIALGVFWEDLDVAIGLMEYAVSLLIQASLSVGTGAASSGYGLANPIRTGAFRRTYQHTQPA